MRVSAAPLCRLADDPRTLRFETTSSAAHQTAYPQRHLLNGDCDADGDVDFDDINAFVALLSGG